MSEELKPVAFPPLPKGYVTLDGLTRYDAMQVHQYALRYADAVVAAQSRQAAQPVATITECEACFTPDVCRLRGKCDHYSAEQVRVAAQPQQAAQPVAQGSRVCWLVEEFSDSGNSTGRYMLDQNGLTITTDAQQARRFLGSRTATFRATDMREKWGTAWRPVSHVFRAAQPQQATDKIGGAA